jgi:hypothetical protein
MNNLKSVERQANLYMFDLNNLALENGCQTDNNWEVKQATLDEKKELERSYQLTMSTKYLPEEMGEMLRLVQFKLNNPVLGKVNETTTNNSGGNYLIAFHTGRLKR